MVCGLMGCAVSWGSSLALAIFSSAKDDNPNHVNYIRKDILEQKWYQRRTNMSRTGVPEGKVWVSHMVYFGLHELFTIFLKTRVESGECG